MNILGAVIKHDAFGEGTILDQSGNYLFIAFPGGKKEFLYPNAFSKYLTAVDPTIAAYIKNEVVKYEASEAAITESNRMQRIAAQNAHRDAIQKAAAAAKPRKKKPVKVLPKVVEEAKP